MIGGFPFPALAIPVVGMVKIPIAIFDSPEEAFECQLAPYRCLHTCAGVGSAVLRCVHYGTGPCSKP